MAFKTNLIRHLLGVLTPEEISELISESAGVSKISLMEIASYQLKNGSYEVLIEEHKKQDEEKELTASAGEEGSDDDHKAKILPFGSVENSGEDQGQPVHAFSLTCGERVKSLMSDYVQKCAEMDKEVLGARVRKKSKKSGRKESSLFILEERKRMERAVQKLRTKEVLDLYSSSLKQEIMKKSAQDPEEDGHEKFETGKKTGILLNKKIA